MATGLPTKQHSVQQYVTLKTDKITLCGSPQSITTTRFVGADCSHLGLNGNPPHSFLMKDKKRGQITIEENKKHKEIISEQGRKVEVPTHSNAERKKALEQTGEDATQGW